MVVCTFVVIHCTQEVARANSASKIPSDGRSLLLSVSVSLREEEAELKKRKLGPSCSDSPLGLCCSPLPWNNIFGGKVSASTRQPSPFFWIFEGELHLDRHADDEDDDEDDDGEQ
ncbi:unnamed protein product [Pleuronectes platessa]|uniref:Uncharacterized protein n=1 Tax=Pleuronectes platessa TaxID=8262 RepID=A0A9N7V109_PLEPL|nr:unnamed protein product [Pleuronectes platessa]